MRRLLFLTLFILVSQLLWANSPKYEMRAVWLTTNWRLDWPSKPATDKASMRQQQQELCSILDEVKELGLNTVFFQTRIYGEVLYPSEIEPWSRMVSGESGRSPGYDVLAFAIEECHRRGLECHAWLITIPAGSSKHVQMQGNKALPMRHPEMCIKQGTEWYLNPGIPETAEYIASIAQEIAYNYDVDGIHLDYIRYPDKYEKFPDYKTYQKYAEEGEPLEEWRMNNITDIVRAVCDEVKSVDEYIMLSAAPLGRYAPVESQPFTSWTCVGGVSQDAINWIYEGNIDFVAPMMYYKGDGFTPYLIDWVERIAGEGNMVAGLGAYRLDPKEGKWSLDDIDEQIKASRDYGSQGQAYFRWGHLREYPSLARLLQEQYYNEPALVPPMCRVDGIPLLDAVTGLQVESRGKEVVVSWQAVDDAVRYVVYATTTGEVDINNPSHIVNVWVNGTTVQLPDCYHSFAVTAVDIFRREGAAAYSKKP